MYYSLWDVIVFLLSSTSWSDDSTLFKTSFCFSYTLQYCPKHVSFGLSRYPGLQVTKLLYQGGPVSGFSDMSALLRANSS